VYFTSGSFPRLPTSMTLLTLFAMGGTPSRAQYNRIVRGRVATADNAGVMNARQFWLWLCVRTVVGAMSNSRGCEAF
jgi:hypothetical protein